MLSHSYVPIKVDYSDLYDAMTFFRGSPDGKNGHDELAKQIGLAGQKWAQNHVRALSSLTELCAVDADEDTTLLLMQWRKQDMAAYMFRLSLEWGRLLHRGNVGENESLDFEMDFDEDE